MNIEAAKKQLMKPENFERFITSIQLIIRMAENAPKRSESEKEREELDRQIPKSKRGSNLIDRAKKANRDDPRMGSGREDTKKAAGPVSSKTSGVHRVSYSKRDKDGKTK